MLWKFVKKLLYWGLFLTLVATVVLIVQFQRFQQGTISITEPDRTFTIEAGSSIKSIARQLSLENIVDDPWLFILLAKLKGVETRVRAGEYRLQQEQTPNDLLELFTSGQSIQYSFTIIEGWSFRQMLQAIEADPVMTHSLKDKSDAEIMTMLGYPEQHPEGMFFPDTYRFPKGTSDIKFLRRAYDLMQTQLQREWQKRSPGLPLNSAYEALILASIIEKETAVASERPLIASVFIRR